MSFVNRVLILREINRPILRLAHLKSYPPSQGKFKFPVFQFFLQI